MKTLITVWNPELRNIIFSPETRRKLEAVSEVHWVPEGIPYGQEDLLRDIGPYDACITSWGSPKLDADVLRKADRLKFIGHAAGTMVSYVGPAAFAKGIVVVNANLALARSTAELTVSLMLAGSWNLMGYSRNLAAGIWRSNSDTVAGLYGRRIGLIGYGEVAREVIRLLQPFDPDILLCSPYCSEEEAERSGVTLASLDEVLATCDVVSLHDTLTRATRGMLGREQLRLMKDGALLVNTARAALIDEAALIEELSAGRINAAIDVYYEEPPGENFPLLHLPNVLCVPHIGAFSRYWKPQLGQMLAEDLARFAAGEPLLRRITEEKFYRMTER
ncbi:hydroxyacid dehydrogenase [Paenibacillus hamazuiensis]|uniref:hydroxyacid dehydrogenase n=1 Tax=Paenibacillus hamazuiensis TaxID=2936508 RepID=UPI00200BA68A|nr:hydroxyacid dehydrogenase [Paenibacillus hamazuiensis]